MYTDDNILLGVFRSSELAEIAKQKYISDVENNDPHSQPDVCLQDDVSIESLDDYIESIDGDTVYILNEQVEDFGQITREILKVSTSLEEILNLARSKHIAPDDFPTCYVYNKLIVDKLYYENDDHYIQT